MQLHGKWENLVPEGMKMLKHDKHPNNPICFSFLIWGFFLRRITLVTSELQLGQYILCVCIFPTALSNSSSRISSSFSSTKSIFTGPLLEPSELIIPSFCNDPGSGASKIIVLFMTEFRIFGTSSTSTIPEFFSESDRSIAVPANKTSLIRYIILKFCLNKRAWFWRGFSITKWICEICIQVLWYE